MTKVQRIVLAGVLIAVQIILTRILGIDLGVNQRITFAFIAIVVNGALLGPVTAGISGGIADILGFILKPTGAYFPGFTLTAVLTGVVYGLFFYKKEITISRIVLSNLIVSIPLNLFLGSYWLHLLLGSPMNTLLMGRLPFNLILLVVKIVVLAIVLPRIVKEMRKVLKVRAA
ncbi:folate family ECF transporter S component [Peptoniphilus sp. KCTC 25270]|uniref:folate family ECF transporter S component n=1 Tax=Peptoniphilus sp. KCTC 25270 TaxID=2897414 RepID=UPI001E61DD51|nr:folate family ECF transporter S component [Peptoniphilus sp. KCTC 25270]MCD1146725.1 folate family ECF transporter S component [Peptoniphilus sp. KCTC 25270]